MNKNIIRLGIGILFLLVSLSIAWIVTVGQAAETAQSAKQSEQATTGELHQLLKARYDIAASLLEIEEKRFNERRGTLLNVFEAARRVRDSAMELTGTPTERLAALTKYLAVTRRLEDSMNSVVEKGVAPSSDRELARYLRLDAEIALLQTKLQKSGAGKTTEGG
jgi:hypothetical protein